MPQNFTKFCEMRFKLCEMYEFLKYKTKLITKLITKFGSFWSEIRNEIWSISNEVQAKARQYLSMAFGLNSCTCVPASLTIAGR